MIRVVCDEPCVGMRLDAFLAQKHEGLSRRRAREACEAGHVLVDGAPRRPGYYLRLGETVTATLDPSPARARPEHAASQEAFRRDFSVAFEDDLVLAVVKPRGMASVTLRGDDPLTLADCVAAHAPQCREASPDPREAGLVQRLDHFTSGVLLAAKNRPTWHALREQLLAGEMRKRYVALVEGWPARDSFMLKYPLSQEPSGKRMRVHLDRVAEDPKAGAYTMCNVLTRFEESGGRRALVSAQANRAKRHQIRAHLAAAGHPLVGDLLYGATTRLDPREWGEGFLLHAAEIMFFHPGRGELLTVAAPSPPWVDPQEP